MSHLFSPLRLRDLTLKNRLWVSPMCQYSAVDGMPNDWHLVHIGSRAVGGAGLILMEATAVLPDGRISRADLGIWSDQHVDAFARIAQFVTAQGSLPGLQLAHAGRKGSTEIPWLGNRSIAPSEELGWQPVAPSPISFYTNTPAPKELSDQEMKEILIAFQSATYRAMRAGFKVLELHMAHGYLLHEFLSPLTNKRTDNFGGSFENRIRFPLEIIKVCRDVWPDTFPLFVRLSATDWVEGGWDLEQSIAVSHEMKKFGVDLIDVSSGGLIPNVSLPIGPSYQVPFAEAIKNQVALPTAAVGLITEADQAERILKTGQADAIFMGRALLRDPYYPLRAKAHLDGKADWPNPYLRAIQT